MAQAINDVDSLRRFQKELQTLSDNLNSQLRNVSGKVNNLSKTWQDKQFSSFKTQFEQDK